MSAPAMPTPQRYPVRLTGNDFLDQQSDVYPLNPAPSYGWQPSLNNDSQAPALRGEIYTGGGRTPSPTPSEVEALNNKGGIPRTTEFWFSKQGIIRIIIIVIFVVITVLFSVFQDKIIKALTPFTQKIHNLRFGWLIPVGIIFVLSFPPLGGQGIVALLCGVAWGLWQGFAIVALGTLLGEVGNYFVFKWCCTARARKYEKTKIFYACLTRILRDGGFIVALAARYSIVPSHLTTAVFASSGLGFMAFIPAVVCSLPTQFATVLLGVLFEDEALGRSNSKEKTASTVITVITVVITILAMRFIRMKINQVKPQIIYERRKARQMANLKKTMSESMESL